MVDFMPRLNFCGGQATFEEGIHSLGAALEKIWETLAEALTDSRKRARLRELKESGVPDYQFNSKTRNKLHHGPYAMLVRDSAFRASEMGNHDYLALPEIIEDICNGYELKYKERIHGEVARALRRCIVTFEVSERDSAYLLKPSLYYCWCIAHNEELSLYANTCYDANGVTVPRSAIQSIEFL
jgi:hypothetical protein